MSSNFSHAWSTEACPVSVDAPDADGSESWRSCISSNALFRAQPVDSQFDRVDANHSPDESSACVPNLLTEFVFFFHLACFLLIFRSTC
jgi:hypothetical protein